MTKINIALGFSLIICALLLINSQYQARRLFFELEREQSLSKQYETEWTQLRLDQSIYGKTSRIESVARNELNMVPVTPERTQFLKAADIK
jgi:cell division protein FtsL